MYVISINENLIETLRLIVQNEPLFASNENHSVNDNATDNLTLKNTLTATALLNEQIDRCKPTEQIWLVLVAKDWEQNVINTILTISRMLMSQTKVSRAFPFYNKNKYRI